MKLQTQADTFFVGSIIGPETAAAYGLTIRAQQTGRMLIAQFWRALLPSLAHLFGGKHEQRFRDVMSRIFVIVVLVGASFLGAVVAFNEIFMELWVGSELFAGADVTAAFAAAGLISIAASIFYNVLVARGEFRITRRIFMITGLIHICLLITLLNYGPIGAPVAAALSSSAWGLGFAVVIHRRLSMESSDWLPFVRFFLISVVAAAMGWAIGSLITTPSWTNLFFGSLISICISAAIMMFADPRARKVVREEIKNTWWRKTSV